LTPSDTGGTPDLPGAVVFFSGVPHPHLLGDCAGCCPEKERLTVLLILQSPIKVQRQSADILSVIIPPPDATTCRIEPD
jgi:hypothetical protein